MNKDIIYVSQCLTKAVERGYIKLNPCKQISKLKETKGRLRFLSRDEISRMLGAASPHLKRFLMVGLYTGMRLQEMLNLKISDIDFGNHLIHLKNTKDFQTKNRRDRSIPIPKTLESELQKMVKHWVQPKTGVEVTRTLKQTKYLFCHQNGQP